MNRRKHLFPLALCPALGAVLVLSMASGCAEGEDVVGEADQAAHRTPLNPIVFAHGCPPPPFTNEQEAQFFDDFVEYFRARGYPDDYLNVFVLPGPTCPSNVDWAVELGDYVRAVRKKTSAPRVDIIAHSMGPVAGRIYLRQGGDQIVDHFVSLVGGNHGSEMADEFALFQLLLGAPWYEGGKELYPPYACEGESTPADVQFFLNGCLTPTGRTAFEDETPGEIGEGGRVSYLSVYNPLDEIVRPPESACLNQAYRNDCSDPVNVKVVVPPGPLPAHVMILSNPTVMDLVYDFVAGD